MNYGNSNVKGTDNEYDHIFKTLCGQLIYEYIVMCYSRGLLNSREGSQRPSGEAKWLSSIMYILDNTK